MMDYKKCIDCKLCMDGCLMMEEFTDSPKTLLETIQNSPANVAFSCAACGYCEVACPKDISIKEYFVERKKELAPTELHNFGYRAVLFHQVLSFSKPFTTIKKFTDKDYSHVAFMPGCALSSYSPKLVESIISHLQKVSPGMGVLMQCCGKPTHVLGDMPRFGRFYSALERDIERLGATTIVTACENCYMSLKTFTPHVKTISLYEWLDYMGIPECSFEDAQTVALHDPCPTRHELALHQSVRSLLNKMKLPFEEFEFNREKTQCCGSGGMLDLTNSKLAHQQKVSRANQTDCETIVSYCQECSSSMTRGGKNGIHILDLLFDETIVKNFKQPRLNLLTSWMNRYKTKQKIKNFKVKV